MTRSPSPLAPAPAPAVSTARALARTLPLALSLVWLAGCRHVIGGGSSSSSAAATAIGPAPYLVVQPTTQTVTVGSAATFSAQSTAGATYQWYKNAAAITGATGPSYTIATTAVADADTYYVVATVNSAGTRSALAPLVVNAATAGAPVLTAQPAGQTVASGGTATFGVTATGSGTLAYQWFKDNAALAGATSPTLTVAQATSASAGNYTVQVTSAAGTTPSAVAPLVVAPVTTASACDPTYVNGVINGLNALQTAIGTSSVSALQYLPATYTTAQLNGVKSSWADLPTAPFYNRPGPQLSELSVTAAPATTYAAFNALVQAALAPSAQQDFQGILAADDYLGYTLGLAGYGAERYHVVGVNTPSATGQWTLVLNGHHLDYILTFSGGCLYPTPVNLGAEPKEAFTANNHFTSTYGTQVYAPGTYTAVAPKTSAMLGIYQNMTADELSRSFLAGQTFADAVLGPVEGGTGVYTAAQTQLNAVAASPARGALVTSLSANTQNQVTAAVTQFVSDYDAATRTRLLADFQGGYGATYVAWADASGAYSATGPDPESAGTYLRVEGPRLWLELAYLNTVTGPRTRTHLVFRDKLYDYGDRLAPAS